MTIDGSNCAIPAQLDRRRGDGHAGDLERFTLRAEPAFLDVVGENFRDEERDVQIRGYPIRLNLDVCLVFSANPEDYTNRGRIVTPLKDRIGSVIRTHYPETIAEGIEIARQNAWVERGSEVSVSMPPFMAEII